jgi:hypothetical protein
MPKLTPLGEVRARLRALRLFVVALRDKRLHDLDALLSVAECETERVENVSQEKRIFD